MNVLPCENRTISQSVTLGDSIQGEWCGSEIHRSRSGFPSLCLLLSFLSHAAFGTFTFKENMFSD